ncbi:M23 family metallopeptidase [Stenotrophomonas sp. 278]|uniref:M23 family metallopeptidase n=1 Tax=Stenotrophomonas sp. 278 TaxID=2479851 RepID=UPI000F68E9ED|nr:M23 family metallopeptidase [Stenotrophomonas sp. 278]RRU20753.1 M23 family metallopeptidase [Stenotrophomonas sp. 278]
MNDPRPTGIQHAIPKRSVAWRLRGWLVGLLLLAMLAVTAMSVWNSEWLKAPRALWELSRMPPPVALPVPVEGVAARRIADTFGAPRGRDRTHAGVDIFAKRGTPVRSATAGVIVAVRDTGLGGRQVWVAGPARERYYYAHLEDWRAGLREGEVVAEGDVLGYVGTTGNAAGTPPHLHWGIYGADGAYDPLPLLRAWKPPADSAQR